MRVFAVGLHRQNDHRGMDRMIVHSAMRVVLRRDQVNMRLSWSARRDRRAVSVLGGRTMTVTECRMVVRRRSMVGRIRMDRAVRHGRQRDRAVMRRFVMLSGCVAVCVRMVRCLIVRSVQGAEMLRVPFVCSPKTFCQTIFHANSLS